MLATKNNLLLFTLKCVHIVYLRNGPYILYFCLFGGKSLLSPKCSRTHIPGKNRRRVGAATGRLSLLLYEIHRELAQKSLMVKAHSLCELLLLE